MLFRQNLPLEMDRKSLYLLGDSNAFNISPILEAFWLCLIGRWHSQILRCCNGPALDVVFALDLL